MIPRRFVAWMTVSRKCNLRCTWCYAQQTGFKRDMDISIVDKCINVFKGLPLSSVILIGGEPTIHPQFNKIVKMISQSGLRPSVVTNSIMFKDKKFLSETVEAGITGISTSIKAESNYRYKKFTGVAAFDNVMEAVGNIEAIKDPKFFHKISVTICKSIFDCFDDVLDMISGSGVKMVSFDLERPIIIDNKAVFEDFASPKEMADFLVAAYPKMEQMGVRFNIKIGIPFCLFPEDFIEMLTTRHQIISGCQIFDGKGIIVDEQGRILPCNHFCDNPLGELGSTGDEYIRWRQGVEIEDFYNKIGSYPDKKCVDCNQWKYCGGGCRIHWLYKGANEMLPNNAKRR